MTTPEQIKARGDITMGDECPRCGKPWMRSPQALNAVSRTTRGPDDEIVYVCSPCGEDEGMKDFLDGGHEPQSDWPVEHRYTFSSPIVEEPPISRHAPFFQEKPS